MLSNQFLGLIGLKQKTTIDEHDLIRKITYRETNKTRRMLPMKLGHGLKH